MKTLRVLSPLLVLLTIAAPSSIQASPVFELDSLKRQKPYVLEIRYGHHEMPPAHSVPQEPSAEFLAHAASLNLRVAERDAGQIAGGPFTFGFILEPKAETFAVAFQGDYEIKESGKSFQGTTLVPLNQWIVLAETITKTFTSQGEQRQGFSVAMRLRKD